MLMFNIRVGLFGPSKIHSGRQPSNYAMSERIASRHGSKEFDLLVRFMYVTLR